MFDELLQSAVAMKRGETEQQRQRFASYSSLFQATLFVDNPAVIAARRFPRLQDRLRVSVELKQLANRTLKGERTVNTSGGEEVSDKRLPPVDSATAAMHQYEASYGVLQYAESAGVDAQGQPWWRTRGLQDRDLTFYDATALRQDLTKEEEEEYDSRRVQQQGNPSSSSLRNDVIQHLVSVLCNYAICVQQVPRYPEALSCATQALREALLWDPSNLRKRRSLQGGYCDSGRHAGERPPSLYRYWGRPSSTYGATGGGDESIGVRDGDAVLLLHRRGDDAVRGQGVDPVFAWYRPCGCS